MIAIRPCGKSRLSAILKALIPAAKSAIKEVRHQIIAMDEANRLPYLPSYTTFEKGWNFIDPDPLRYGVRVVTGLGGFEYIEPVPQPRQDPDHPKYPPINNNA